jgi:hypothetical protein
MFSYPSYRGSKTALVSSTSWPSKLLSLFSISPMGLEDTVMYGC